MYRYQIIICIIIKMHIDILLCDDSYDDSLTSFFVYIPIGKEKASTINSFTQDSKYYFSSTGAKNVIEISNIFSLNSNQHSPVSSHKQHN